MSLPAIRSAIYARLSTTSAVTALVANRIYYLLAPAGAALPYLVFEPATGDLDNQTARQATRQRWQVRAYATTPALAETVASACADALHNIALEIAGWTTTSLFVVQESAAAETAAGQHFYHHALDITLQADG